MLLQEKIGHLSAINVGKRAIETVFLEWFETGKKILHKKTDGGRQVVLKFLKEGNAFAIGDVLFQNDQYLIVIDIVPADAIIFHPANMYEMATLCYEIGNRHMPLFYDGGELALPYDAPLYNLLLAAGYHPEIAKRKLHGQMKTAVLPHQHSGTPSLFSRIMQLTSANND